MSRRCEKSNDDSFQYGKIHHGYYAAMRNESPIKASVKATGVRKKDCGSV